MDTSQFDHVIESTKEDLASLHTGRVTPALVEDVAVEAYDSQMRLQELASISAPEPQMLVIEPWDKSVVKNIESSLRKSDLDINPVVDGSTIRINFPPLTEEKRVQLTKVMHEKIEHGRIAVRRVREELLKGYKAQEKDGEISEDDYYRLEKEVQSTVDQYNTKLKELADKKEQELMSV